MVLVLGGGWNWGGVGEEHIWVGSEILVNEGNGSFG